MKNILFLILVFLLSAGLMAQNRSYTLQKTITNPEQGFSVQTEQSAVVTPVDKSFITNGLSRNLNINWQLSDPVGIGSRTKVSGAAGYTFNEWWLNNVRVSLYQNSSTPIWEQPVVADWEWPIEMTNDGAYVAYSYGNLVQVYETATQTLVWEKTTDATSIIGLKFNLDATKIYVVENMPNGLDKTNVRTYTIGVSDPDWTTGFAGAGTSFAASGDCSKLVFCQYGTGLKKMWVMDSSDGSVIFDGYYYNQAPPAFSYDGKYLVSGDYSGYAYLHEYDYNNNTYNLKWNYKVGGGGTSVWVSSVGISADGLTVAVGTLVFFSSSFDGEIYTFNSYSPEPLWVYQNAGDEVVSIDLSDDGSLIAASGWGPLNHTKPDFFLFRRQSNVPLFSVNTPGSFNAMDLSGDGTFCSVTGKAVHAREMGSGGTLYNINTNPGGGTLSGTVTLLGATNGENVKIEVQGITDYYDYSDHCGLYAIKYVPAGTYTVTAKKVGYFPITVENVVISDGQVLDLDFEMEETGNPPVLFNVSHGAGLSVGVEWTHPQPNDVVGFNVYRKTIAEGLFPESPIAILGNDEFSYLDEDVLPLKTYYYAVTAAIGDDYESPYSNTMEGWIATGYVANNISVYYGTTPTIDGTISPGEWVDAFKLDASDFLGTYDNVPNPIGSVTMYYKVNQAMTELYIACDNQNDVVLEDNDVVALYIDDNNDGAYGVTGDDSEGNYWAEYHASGNKIRYRPLYNTGGTGTIIELANPQIAISNATGHIVYEFVIPMGADEVWKLNPNNQNQSGIFLFARDAPSSFDGYWPCQNQQIFEPAGYGDITFGASDEVPPPPANVTMQVVNLPPIFGVLEWSQPDINDFEGFIVYIDHGNGFELLDQTFGTQLFYMASPPEVADFYVTTVDQSGQESEPSETVFFDPFVGIPENGGQCKMNVYPNPASGEANISFDISESGNYQLAVFDLEGRQVKNLVSAELNTGHFVFSWNGANDAGTMVKNGVYFMKLTGNNQSFTSKVVLMR